MQGPMRRIVLLVGSIAAVAVSGVVSQGTASGAHTEEGMAATLGPGSLIRPAQRADRRDGAVSILLRNGIAAVASTLRGPRLFKFAFLRTEAASDRYICVLQGFCRGLQACSAWPLYRCYRCGASGWAREDSRAFSSRFQCSFCAPGCRPALSPPHALRKLPYRPFCEDCLIGHAVPSG